MKKFYLQNDTKRAIKKRVKDAIRFLEKTGVIKNQKKPTLSSLPYYIMLGSQNSGKTTLLAKSELKFILSQKNKDAEKIQLTKNYNWWATEHAVIIDTPGKYFTITKNKINNIQKYFFRLIRKHNDSVRPAGILLVVDLNDFLRKSKTLKQDFFRTIREQLSTITKVFHANIPTYLIFNKSDLITGFREYFDDLSREERQQAWGNLIKIRKITDETFADNFNEIFNKMVRRLNDQLIWHLQHEHNQNKRILINEFPNKIAQLKKPINYLLNNAFRKLGKEFCPAGVFFVSATQEKIADCYEHDDAVSSTCRSLINIQPSNNKAYFVHDLFCNHLLAEKIPIAKKRNLFYRSNLPSLFIYPVLIILIGFFTYMCWYKYNRQISIIDQAQQLIIDNQLSNNKNKKFNTLFTLQQINSTLANLNPWFTLIPNQANRELQQKISALYSKQLNSIMLPKIISLLKKNLRAPKLPPATLYNSLKSYLMLGAAEKYDATYLENSLYMLLTNDKSKTNQDILPYLSDWLEQNTPKIKLNKHLIKSARNHLQRLSPVDLAFAILSNKSTNNKLLSLNLNTNSQAAYVFTFVNNDNTIQGMYTAQNFAKIYPDLINTAAIETIKGNWVLGKTKFSRLNIDKVTQQLTDKYLLNYANTWLQFISNIKMVHFTEINNLAAAVQLLSNDNSPLLSLAKLIQNNIVPQVAAISPTLKNFAALSNDISQQNSSKNVIVALKNLAIYLQPISDTNTDKLVFTMTSMRMFNNGAKENDPIEHLLEISQNYPEPLKSWLYDLGTNAWHLMLMLSENYINDAWQKNILPQYNAQIANRFPFDNTCSNDVSLTSFSYFFAPDGLLAKFFKNYLSPFV
ncbi:MAG: ImcF-related family protein, partial [Gammaproteobacteria bacterium]